METMAANVREAREYGLCMGRPSTLGKPLESGLDGTRMRAINLFERRLRDRICFVHFPMEFLPGIYGVVLGCYCAPQPC